MVARRFIAGRGLLALLALLLPPALRADEAAAPPLPRGELIERLAASKDPALTYALYLPKTYRPERRWPVLYAFDARGDARGLVGRLRAAAERWGWIVASPGNASDAVPMEDNFKIMSGMWADTHARLAIDDRRVYAFGFSGLSRFVCMLGLTAPESLAGVIGASGGFPLGHPPTRDTPFPFFALVGDKDYNYYEVLDLDEKMDALGIPHRVEVFPGGHEWPPEAAISTAFGWLELQAMRGAARETSPALIADLWEKDLARARALEESGQRLEADRAYTALAADFAGLRDARDLEDAARRRTALEATAAFQHDRAARQERDRRDRDYLERVPKVLAAANPEMGREGLSQALAELSVPDLKRRMASAADPAEKLSAERLLSAVYIQTALHLPREAVERKQYDRAIFDLQIAAEIDPAMAQIPFRLAVTWAQKGDRRQALDALASAVDKGWTDLLALESERAFDPLRQSDEYRTIVSELLRRQRPADNPLLNPLPRAAPIPHPDRERGAPPPRDLSKPPPQGPSPPAPLPYPTRPSPGEGRKA